MKIKYDLICEDFPQKYFLERFLEKYKNENNDDFDFVSVNSDFSSRAKKKVIKSYADAAILAFSSKNIDIFFIGTDYDDHNRNEYFVKRKELQDKITDKIRDNCVVFFPVQAIETWLWYIKNYNSNANVRKGQLEKKNRNEAKIAVWGTKRTTDEMVKRNLDDNQLQYKFSWLCQKSESFNDFFISFEKTLDKLKKKC